MMRSRTVLPQGARRGSVFVLVVAILAVIALLTLTLAYSTRMELQASRNSADMVQARLSSLTGVPFVTPGNPVSTGLGGQAQTDTPGGSVPHSPYSTTRERRQFVALSLTIDPKAQARSEVRDEAKDDTLSATGHKTTDLQRANERERRETKSTEEGRLSQGGESEAIIGDLGTFNGPISTSTIHDESAKLNLNALLPPAVGELPAQFEPILNLADPKRAGPVPAPNAGTLAALIDRIATLKEINLERAAQDLVRDIIEYRYGDDALPGVRGQDDNANGGNVRPGSDGLDNDGDWVIDNPEEETLAVDADGRDNDFDGVVDEMDESLIQNGLDDNNNGLLDDPAEIMDEPAEFVADIRRAPVGDDRPYTSLASLGVIKGMTPELIGALTPYLTVFSVSQPAYPARKTSAQTNSETGLRQLDPNTASAEEMFDALRAQYPTLPENLLAQFAVNIVDRRDRDSIPTEEHLGAAQSAFRGLELSPCISEVFPFTGGFDQGEMGDDGQFVEIVNPYTTAIDLSGWRIEGVGMTVYLSGSLQGGGLLVITDDYNNSTDPEPEDVPGQGSLYDIFGVVPIGGDARLEVQPMLNLNNEAGSVRLLDRSGVLVDEFKYEGGKFSGALRYSFQRKDPRMPKSLYTREDCDYGTPLKKNHGESELTPEERKVMQVVERFHNQPFRSPLEILLVPTNYDEADLPADPNADLAESSLSGAQARSAEGSDTAHGLRLPYLAGSADSRQEHGNEDEVDETVNNLDVTVVDLFMPGVAPRRATHMTQFLGTDSLVAGDSLQPAVTVQTDRIEQEWGERRDEPPALLGRINLNTAAPVMLSTLPGFGEDFAYVVAVLREEWMYGKSEFQVRATGAVNEAVRASEGWLKALPPLESVRWRALSDLLADDDVWGADTELISRIEASYPFASLIAFNSLSYRVVTENIPPPVQGGGGRRSSLFRTERIIAGDRGKPETVRFRPLAGRGWAETDRDIKYGLPEGTTQNLGLGLLAKADLTPMLPRYDGPAFGVSVPNIQPAAGRLNQGLRRGGPTAAARPASAPAEPAPATDSATSRAPLN